MGQTYTPGGELPTLEDFGIFAGVRRQPFVEPIGFFEKAIGYHPYRQQREFHLAKERVKIVIGAKRIGKSFMGARDLEPLIVTPETHTWLVGATYKRCHKEFEYLVRDLVQRAKLGTTEFNHNVRGGYMNIRFAHDSVVEVISAKDLNNLESEALDQVMITEPQQLTEDVFELCRERVAEKRGVVIMAGTATSTRHWLKKRFDYGHDPAWEDYWSIRIPATETPYPGAEEVGKLERELSPNRFRRDVLAEFLATEELVLQDFEECLHVDDLGYTKDLPLYWAFDFGYAAPWVCLWVQVDHSSKRVYVLREHYVQFETDADNIAAVKAWHRAAGWDRTAFNVGDPHGAAALAELRSQGVDCVGSAGAHEGDKDRGTEILRQLLKVRPDGKPGIVFDRECENTIDECGLWQIDPRTGKPKDRDDHAMTALLYLLLELFGEGEAEPGIDFV